MSFWDMPKNVRATWRGIRDKMLAAHWRFMAAISASDGLCCRCASDGDDAETGEEEEDDGAPRLPLVLLAKWILAPPSAAPGAET